MKKKMSKVMCLMLVILTVLPMMFACNQNTTTTPPATDTQANTEETGPTGWQDKFDVPTTKYDGEVFNILSAGPVTYEDFGFDDDSINVFEQAQYKRELKILNDYGVSIALTTKMDKSSSGNGAGYQDFYLAASSNSLDYHLGLITAYDVAQLTVAQALYDINALPYVDTRNSWWDQNANKDLSIQGMLFYTNGNLTCAYSESTFYMYMNNVLAKEKLDPNLDVYQLVKDGKWTIDKLGEFVKTTSEDLDGNDVMDGEDRYGIYVWDDACVATFAAGGSKIVTMQDDGSMKLTMYNENTINMFNAFADVSYDANYALQFQRPGKLPKEGVPEAFSAGKALFWMSSGLDFKYLRDMDNDYSLLPYPMLDENQGRYYSTIAPYLSQFICVPFYLDDKAEYVGHITEALAYYGKEYAWPACYENTMKGIYARDDGSVDMLDIIFSSYGYDLGLYYKTGDYIAGLFDLFRASDRGFASMYTSRITAATEEIKIMNKSFEEIAEMWNDLKKEQ